MSFLKIKTYDPHRPGYTKRMPKDKWMIYQELIQQLRAKGKTRQQVLDTLHGHGFEPSMGQLDTKLAEWDLTNRKCVTVSNGDPMSRNNIEDDFAIVKGAEDSHTEQMPWQHPTEYETTLRSWSSVVNAVREKWLSFSSVELELGSVDSVGSSGRNRLALVGSLHQAWYLFNQGLYPRGGKEVLPTIGELLLLSVNLGFCAVHVLNDRWHLKTAYEVLHTLTRAMESHRMWFYQRRHDSVVTRVRNVVESLLLELDRSNVSEIYVCGKFKDDLIDNFITITQVLPGLDLYKWSAGISSRCTPSAQHVKACTSFGSIFSRLLNLSFTWFGLANIVIDNSLGGDQKPPVVQDLDRWLTAAWWESSQCGLHLACCSLNTKHKYQCDCCCVYGLESSHHFIAAMAKMLTRLLYKHFIEPAHPSRRRFLNLTELLPKISKGDDEVSAAFMNDCTLGTYIECFRQSFQPYSSQPEDLFQHIRRDSMAADHRFPGIETILSWTQRDYSPTTTRQEGLLYDDSGKVLLHNRGGRSTKSVTSSKMSSVVMYAKELRQHKKPAGSVSGFSYQSSEGWRLSHIPKTKESMQGISDDEYVDEASQELEPKPESGEIDKDENFDRVLFGVGDFGSKLEEISNGEYLRVNFSDTLSIHSESEDVDMEDAY